MGFGDGPSPGIRGRTAIVGSDSRWFQDKVQSSFESALGRFELRLFLSISAIF